MPLCGEDRDIAAMNNELNHLYQRIHLEAVMNKKIWDLYAPIYNRAMKVDQKIYDFMYQRIPEMVKDNASTILLSIDCLTELLSNEEDKGL